MFLKNFFHICILLLLAIPQVQAGYSLSDFNQYKSKTFYTVKIYGQKTTQRISLVGHEFPNGSIKIEDLTFTSNVPEYSHSLQAKEIEPNNYWLNLLQGDGVSCWLMNCYRKNLEQFNTSLHLDNSGLRITSDSKLRTLNWKYSYDVPISKTNSVKFSQETVHGDEINKYILTQNLNETLVLNNRLVRLVGFNPSKNEVTIRDGDQNCKRVILPYEKFVGAAALESKRSICD